MTASIMELAANLSTSRSFPGSTRGMKQDHIISAIQQVWIFLEEHLSLANTHGAEFISHGHWDKFIPRNAQEQLLALTHDQLVNLFDSWRDLSATSNVSATLKDSSDTTAQSRDDRSDSSSCWLQTFIDEAHKCHLGSLDALCPLSDVLTSQNEVRLRDDRNKQCDPDVISEAMSVKKVHEVGVMSEAVADLFKSCNADIVIDVGSGKGYLSCELARHHSIPVLGLDSSDTNTHGALRRDKKLDQRWKGLAKRKGQKIQSKTNCHLPKNSSETSCTEPVSSYTEPVSGNGGDKSVLEHYSDRTQKSSSDNRNDTCSTIINAALGEAEILCKCDDSKLQNSGAMSVSLTEGHESSAANDFLTVMTTSGQCEPKNISCDCTCDVIDRIETAREGGDCCKIHNVCNVTCAYRTCMNNSWKKERYPQDIEERSSYMLSQSLSKDIPAVPVTTIASENSIPSVDAAFSSSKTATPDLRGSVEGKPDRENLQMYVPVTMFVHPKMNLRPIIEHHVGHLCGVESPASADLFLTGLHTCGSLAVTVMRLFLEDPGAVGLCYVGCCYQLMEESLSGEVSSQSGDSSTDHFPLSQFGKQLNLHLGRNARNLASQSVHRIQASGQLQGGDFYWRALLDVLLKELGVPVPERILGMRGLNKRSKSFQEYAVSALKKLNLSAGLLTQELLEEVEEKHKDARAKMSAFFQLKLVLSPVIESLILLDRYLFLLEQDCVESAHLVQLFDPVTSPRCYAIIARKAKNTVSL